MKIEKSLLRDFMCLICGAASVPYIRAVGNIYALDIISAVGFLFLLSSGFIGRLEKLPKLILIFLVLWLIGAVVGDIINRSAIEDCIRGWSKIITFGSTFIVLWSLIGQNAKRLCIFIVGMSVATIIQTTLYPTPFQIDDPWKFGYSIPISSIAIVFISGIFGFFRPGPLIQVLVISSLAIINAVLNFRSLFAVLFVTSVVLALNAWATYSFGKKRVMTLSFSVVMLGLFGLGAVGSTSIYGMLASRGILGQAAQMKYVEQTRAGMGILLGGRTESIVSTRAIADSPIIGHGSWAADPEYAELYILLLRERGAKLYYSTATDDHIPSHSYLLGSWVENGIFGGLFWVLGLGLAVFALLRLIDFRSRYVSVYAFLICQLVWDIPFSPFGAEARFSTAIQLVAALTVLIYWYLFTHPGAVRAARQVGSLRITG